MNIKPYTYLIRFKPSGQCYYGSRIKNVKLGLTPEEDLMLKYTTSSKEINRLINEYGLDAFEWEVRKKFETTEQAVLWEQRVLKRCKVLERQHIWLNKNIAGHIIATPEICKKISDSQKGKLKPKRSNEHKKNLSSALKGRKSPTTGMKYSSESKAKMSDAKKNKKLSDETKLKMSLAAKGRPNVACKGRTWKLVDGKRVWSDSTI